jgi:hypothetical protein
VLLAGKISEIFYCKFIKETQFESSDGIYRKQKILKNFLSFFVGLSIFAERIEPRGIEKSKSC